MRGLFYSDALCTITWDVDVGFHPKSNTFYSANSNVFLSNELAICDIVNSTVKRLLFVIDGNDLMVQIIITDEVPIVEEENFIAEGYLPAQYIKNKNLQKNNDMLASKSVIGEDNRIEMDMSNEGSDFTCFLK